MTRVNVFNLIYYSLLLGFSNYWRKYVVKYLPINRDTIQRKLSRGLYAGLFNHACAKCFLISFIKSYVVGAYNYLNSIEYR